MSIILFVINLICDLKKLFEICQSTKSIFFLLQVISKSTKLIDVDREENVAFSLDADDNKASTSYSGTAVDGRQVMLIIA